MCECEYVRVQYVCVCAVCVSECVCVRSKCVCMQSVSACVWCEEGVIYDQVSDVMAINAATTTPQHS